MDQRAAAVYYVLYRLTQQGYAASPTSGGQADLMACTAEGTRVALVRVRTRATNEPFRMLPEDRRTAGRNVCYAFVELPAAGARDPDVFLVRPALLAAMLEIDPNWPRDARAFETLEDCRNAWQRLGLGGVSGVRSESVISPA